MSEDDPLIPLDWESISCVKFTGRTTNVCGFTAFMILNQSADLNSIVSVSYVLTLKYSLRSTELSLSRSGEAQQT